MAFLCSYWVDFLAAGAFDLVALVFRGDFHFEVATAAGQEGEGADGSHEVADLTGLLFSGSGRFRFGRGFTNRHIFRL